MLSIKSILSTVLPPTPATDLPPSPMPPDLEPDRLHFDLLGLSDTDAMWYYEIRKWRGRD